ncbi:MAG: PAS domain S-box protein [Cyanophyceae cyanobacterium]
MPQLPSTARALEQILDRSAIAVAPETPLAEAIALLSQPAHRQDSAPVRAVLGVRKGRFVGLLTQQTALQLATTHNVQELTVADGLTQPLTAQASEVTDMAAVQQLFEQHHLEQLPILGDNNAVLGLVTLASLNQGLNAKCRQLTASQNSPDGRHQPQDSEARFQEIAHTIRQFFFVRSAATGQYIYVSPAYETIWGRTCESLYREPNSWLEAVYPEDLPLVLTSLTEQLAGISVTREYRIIQPNGNLRWVFAQINPVKDEAGHVVRFIGVAEDITERKQAEEALRQNQLRLQQLSTSVPAFLYTVVQRVEGSLQFEYVSSEVETIYEIAPERALQDANLIYQQIFPADRKLFFERVRQTVQMLAPFRHEWQIVTPSGQGKWIQAAAQTERRSDGSVAWHGVMLDVSDRKQAEAALQQSEATLRSFFNSSPLMMGVVEVLDHNIRHITDNAATAELFGLTPPQMHHRLASELGMSSQYIELWLHHYRESGQTGKPTQFEYLHAAESDYWLSATVAPVDGAAEQNRFAYIVEDITRRKQAEMELQQTYQRLQFHIENTPLAVIEWDREFRVQRWSPQAAEMFGWQAEEVVGKHWSDWRFVSEADLEAVTLSAQRLLNGGDPRNFSCNRNYTRSGALVYCEWYNSALHDEAGEVVSILSLVQNATVRHQAESRLHEREQFLRSIYNGVEQAIFVVDVTPARNFRYADWNPAAAGAIGKRAAEIADKTFEEVLEPKLAALARDRFTSCLRSGNTLVQEDYLDVAGGTWWLHTLTPLRDGQGEIYRIVGTASNITERKHIEQERDRLLQRVEKHNQILESCVEERTAKLTQINRQLEQEISDRQQAEMALRDSEERYRLIFNQAAVGIAQTTVEGRYLKVNHKLTEILGYSAAELYQNVTTFEITHPDDRAISYEYMHRIVTGELESYSLEKRYLRKDGLPIWVQIFITLLRDSAGNPQYFIKVIEDISARKQTEQALSLSERKFRGAFDTIAVGMAIVAITGGFVEVNAALCQMLGYSETELLGLSFAEITHPEDHNTDQDFWEQLMTGAIPTYQAEKRYLRQDGQAVWGWLSISLIHSTGQPLFLIAQIQDITERKRSEAVLHQKLEQEQLTTAVAQHIRTSLDLDQILKTAVQEVRQLLQADRVSVFRVTPERFGRVIAEALMPGQPSILGMEFPDEQFPVEYYDLYSDGHARIVPNVATDAIAHCIAEFLVELGVRSKLSVPIIQGQSLWGVMTVHHCSATERCWQSWELELIEGLALQLAIAIQQSELYQQLQNELSLKERSLREKTVLLKEVHHRVKNNLQVISSLLWMQSQQVRNEPALQLFKDAQSRVQTLALIHEQLYQTEDLAQVNFGEYLQTLASKLFRSYGIEQQAIALQIEVDAAPLSLEAAIPCGLIVNELVSNSLKYAFPEQRAGAISLRLQTNACGQFVLSVSDNGVGLPQTPPQKSLGLIVVDDLVEQLNGRIELECNNGTCFRIVFPNSAR